MSCRFPLAQMVHLALDAADIHPFERYGNLKCKNGEKKVSSHDNYSCYFQDQRNRLNLPMDNIDTMNNLWLP